MLRGWIIDISSLYEKTLKESVIDENINKKETEELEKFYNSR